MRTLAPLLLAGLAAFGAPTPTRAGDVPASEAPAGPAFAWGLAPSAVAVYDHVTIEWPDGIETAKPLGAHPTTVRGHDVGPDGRYGPATPTLADLPAILALALPPEVAPKSVPLAFDPRDGAAVRGTGSFRVEPDPRDPSRTLLRSTWAFATTGRSAWHDAYVISKGKADVEARWTDAPRGPPATVRIHLAWSRDAVARSARRTSEDVDETFEFRLREVRQGRDEAFAKAVTQAIDEGLEWLTVQQQPDGTYPPHREWSVGTTALALLTLAECDVVRDDEQLDRGLSWLTRQTPTRTYDRALALLAMERAYTPVSEETLVAAGRLSRRIRNLPPDRRAFVERVAAELEASASSPGSWSYPAVAGPATASDSSNTQYAALGLRAASRLSIPVKDAVWVGLARHFGALSERHGPRVPLSLRLEGERGAPAASVADEAPGKPVEALGFLYTPSSPAWASMTCAGITCLELARHELRRARSERLTPALDLELAARIRAGWAWIEAHWGVDRHPEHPTGAWTLYYLYALERAAVFSRVREIGGKDWYFEGATELLLRRTPEGTWKEAGTSELVSTCFALLFLKKAAAPLTDGATR